MTAGNWLDSETPESILIRHEESSMIYALVQGHLHWLREVLVLGDLKDMSYREIADVAGLPACMVVPRAARAPATVAAAWNSAQMTLKDMLP
jgi:DNA-directed RNA polymerase specialized sigma24 family protein